MSVTTLIVPGLGGSGPGHWQHSWQSRHPDCAIVDGINYNLPDCQTWVDGLDAAIARCAEPPVLVAHSIGCMLVAHWSQYNRSRRNAHPVTGALLVAPADVDSPAHTPAEAHTFAPVPLSPLPFPTIVAASTNDPYVDLSRATAFATAWGASFVNLGPLAHVNADSHLDAWDEGWALLKSLTATQQVRSVG